MTECNHFHSTCLMPKGHDDDIKCRFLCSDCGEKYQTDEGRCIRGISLNTIVSMPVSADTRETQTSVTKDVMQAVGEVLMEYALAENTLRELLKELPGYRERSPISEDVRRLQMQLPGILKKTSEEKLKVAFQKCAKDMLSALDAVHSKRNVLAHGQLISFSSWTDRIVATGESFRSEPGRAWYEMTHPDYGKVSLTEPELSEVVVAAKELRRQVGVLKRLAELQQRELDSQEQDDNAP